MVVLEEKCFTTSFRILKTFLKVSKTVTRPSKTIRPRHAVRVEGLRGVALVQDYASRMRCAVRTCVSVRGPFAHDFHFVSSLIGHPQATSFLSSFQHFPLCPGTASLCRIGDARMYMHRILQHLVQCVDGVRCQGDRSGCRARTCMSDCARVQNC